MYQLVLQLRQYQGYVQDGTIHTLIVLSKSLSTVPKALVDQLKDGGRMIVPIGPENGIQELVQVDKREGKIEVTNLMGVRYVPLVHPR